MQLRHPKSSLQFHQPRPGKLPRAWWLGGGITTFYSLDFPLRYFGVFFRDEPRTVLLNIFSALSVIDKNSLEKCKLQKGCGCLQGRGFLTWGRTLLLCLHRLQGAREGARRNCWRGAYRPRLHWGLKMEQPLNKSAWKPHSSRGDYILTLTTTQRTWL